MMLQIARLSASCAHCGHLRVHHWLGGACHSPAHPRCPCKRFESVLSKDGGGSP